MCKHSPNISSNNNILLNESGMALVTALVLGMLGMLMVAAVLFMINAGTWIEGSNRRYQTSLDAAHGGMQFFAKEIIRRGISGTKLSKMGSIYNTPGNNGISFTWRANDADFKTKLTTTGRLGVTPYPSAAVDATITFTVPNANAPATTVDMTIGATTRGNSGRSTRTFLTGGVVNNSSGTVTPQHIPYLYETEIQARPQTGRENAILTAVYIY